MLIAGIAAQNVTKLDLSPQLPHLPLIDAALPREQSLRARSGRQAHSTIRIPKTPITQGSDDRRMSRPVAP
ncbi:MAG: hypothetical protein Gyms2KO_21640 [Gymnodinialimonas sp.]